MLRFAAACMLAGGTAALAASAPVTPPSQALDGQLRQATIDAAAAQGERQRLEDIAARARDDVTRLRAQELAAAQAIAESEAQITAADSRARIAEAKLAAERQRLAARQAPLGSLLAGLALMARRPPLASLADPGSPQELVKLRVLLRTTTPFIQARTATLSRDVERAGQLQREAVEARSDLGKSRDLLADRRDAFAKLEAEAAEVARQRGSQALGAGDVAIVSEERLAQLQQGAASKAASAKLADELAALGPAPVSAIAAGPMVPFAYRLPADAPVADGLGAVSPNGVRSRGATLATRKGAPLVAPADGTILFSGPFRDYDGIIIIDHGGGWKSVLVNAGSKLSRGQKVRIGDAVGIALGPVEIELQHQGAPVSPALIAGSSLILSNGPKAG